MLLIVLFVYVYFFIFFFYHITHCSEPQIEDNEETKQVIKWVALKKKKKNV